jgi:hypothetical protein
MTKKTVNKLERKITVITGGNSGIGLTTAKKFAVEGAHVYITGKDPTTSIFSKCSFLLGWRFFNECFQSFKVRFYLLLILLKTSVSHSLPLIKSED